MTIPTVTGPCSRGVPLRSAIGFLALSVGSAIAEDRPGEPVGAGSALERLVEVRLSDLHTEAGAIVPTGPTSFDLRHPGVRAVVPGAQGSSARISFVYRGPTREVLPLRSGELRRQIGLKLRARDTCNLIYVMWHLAPDEGIRVQVKSNPGARVRRVP